MKIGIIDADLLDGGTRHPNLALMKISGYHKRLGDNVKLLTSYNDFDKYDIVYISKVFTYTLTPAGIENIKNVKIGGTGFFPDGSSYLEPEIEHHMPDYHLYDDYVYKKIADGRSRSYYADYLDYSIGFLTRGCFRKCPFCVNKRYDKVVKHSPISEFFDINRKYIYLWDDNFLGYKNWSKILNELEATNKPFQFRQGLDIRLLTEEKAKRLSKTKYRGDMIFAFDYIEDRNLIEKKLTLWRKYSNKTTKLFLLCAYERQDEIDIINLFERIKILMKYQCLPYIMRYEFYKESNFRSL